MLTRCAAPLSLIAALGAAASPALSQSVGLPAGERIYRLDDQASYQEGCFGGCACPLSQEQPVFGSFRLGPAFTGNVVDFHEVSEIHWLAIVGNQELKITGSGVYRITNYGPPQQHALDLDLSINGAAPIHFFSDFVPVDANDGSIDIPISVNGMHCYDTVIRVSAAVVAPGQLVPYRLRPGSTYQQGCWDPCDCLLEEERPLFGSFLLVPVLNMGTYAVYSLHSVRMHAPASNMLPEAHTLIGSGSYTLIQGFAGPIHGLDLLLRIDGGDPVVFDSGLHNTTATFPGFQIAVDMNDMVCFDIVLDLHAAPVSGGEPGIAPRPPVVVSD
jgi:hypothetical protein